MRRARFAALLFALLPSALLAQAEPAAKPKPGASTTAAAAMSENMVVMPSSSPLYQVQIMVLAGSANDAEGKEGTANLLAQSLIEGGFGGARRPVTKERLAEITRPWGDRALPQVRVDKQTTTFSMTIPRDSFPQFLNQVLRPMFQRPLLLPAEVERLRKEALVNVQSRLRLEQQEQLGLLTLDDYIFAGTELGQPPNGTVKGLRAITRADLRNFYKKYYTRANIFLATSVADAASQNRLAAVLPAGGMAEGVAVVSVLPVPGRHLLIVTQPNAIATGIHFGFPITVKRGDPDYWPLFVGNVSLGTHRDSFGRLYGEIREERGYNYGDYSYIEYYAGRPNFLFPPPATPRTSQYFSVWVRPVAHQYAHFITKAATAEVDRFVREGLTAEQVEAAKNKARTLYLKYAENQSRQLGYRLDDLFYGLRENGYIQGMLKNIDAVTPEQVNAAIKKHLQVANMKYVIVTNEKEAAKLADDIANNTNVVSKTRAEYHITEPVPPEKQALLARDEQWKAYALNIARGNIRVLRSDQLFETTAIPGVSSPAPAMGHAHGAAR